MADTLYQIMGRHRAEPLPERSAGHDHHAREGEQRKNGHQRVRKQVRAKLHGPCAVTKDGAREPDAAPAGIDLKRAVDLG